MPSVKEDIHTLLVLLNYIKLFTLSNFQLYNKIKIHKYLRYTIKWQCMLSQFVMTSMQKRPKSSFPYAFTEYGIVMLASVLIIQLQQNN